MKEGIRFTHNAVTTSICWISRAKLLFTGLYASRHKSLRLRQPVFYATWHNTSWPAILQNAGYFVGHVGKWQYINRGGIVQKLFNWTSIFEGQHWCAGLPASDYARNETIRILRERPNRQPFAATVAFYPPKPVTLNPEPGAQWKLRKKQYENETIPYPYNYSESRSKLPCFSNAHEKTGQHRYNTRYQSSEQYQIGMQNY